ncbi:MAG: hypothetical protein IKU45_02530, partial [Clostridia bacterium]|nr:hypothetical protein [Clostridia bacterium]
CGFFMGISSFLFGKAESSMTGKIMSSNNENAYEKGLLHRGTSKLDLGKRVFRPFKRTVSKQISQSFLLNWLSGYLKGFLFTKCNVYGLMSITVGIGFLLVGILKVYSGKMPNLSFVDTFISLLLCLISIPLLLSSSKLSDAIYSSKNVSVLIFNWLGCRTVSFTDNSQVKGHTRSALPIALLLCIVSWWLRPISMLFALAIFIFGLIVFHTPESGVVLFLFLLPFLYWQYAAYVIIFTGICFLLKYIRGKRTVKFEPLSVCAAMFGVFVLFSYLVTEYKIESELATLQSLCALCAFFIFINLIKSKKWIKRCVNSLVLSCIAVSLYGIAGYLIRFFNLAYLTEVFSKLTYGFGISYFGQLEHLVQYILVVLPFVSIVLQDSTKRERALSFIAFVSGIVCLGLTGNEGALICLIISALAFLVGYSKKSLAFALVLICISLFTVPHLLTHSYDFSNAANSVTTYITDRIGGIASQLKEGMLYFCGTGLGTYEEYLSEKIGNGIGLAVEVGVIGFLMLCLTMFFCLQKNTTMYSKGCGKDGRLLSLAPMISLLSLLLYSGNASVFSDYRINFMFWICIGFAACVSITERRMINIIEEE